MNLWSDFYNISALFFFGFNRTVATNHAQYIFFGIAFDLFPQLSVRSQFLLECRINFVWTDKLATNVAYRGLGIPILQLPEMTI